MRQVFTFSGTALVSTSNETSTMGRHSILEVVRLLLVAPHRDRFGAGELALTRK